MKTSPKGFDNKIKNFAFFFSYLEKTFCANFLCAKDQREIFPVDILYGRCLCHFLKALDPSLIGAPEYQPQTSRKLPKKSFKTPQKHENSSKSSKIPSKKSQQPICPTSIYFFSHTNDSLLLQGSFSSKITKQKLNDFETLFPE